MLNRRASHWPPFLWSLAKVYLIDSELVSPYPNRLQSSLFRCLIRMSALRKIIQIISAASFVLLFSIMSQVSRERPSHGTFVAGQHKEILVDASSWSTSTNEDFSAETRGSINSATSSPSAQFHPGAPKPVGSMYSRVLVVPRLQTDDISWIPDELPDTDSTVYTVNDSLAALHPPKNKGHEVMIYLSYIIEHYDTLPDIIIFMHAHRWTHHNNALLAYDAAEMVRRLQSDYVTREGYVNMRCSWSPGCPEWLHSDGPRESLEKQEETVLSKSWSELFPSDPVPAALGQACCAQFALSRERVLSIPLSRFIFYRDWITRTPLSDYISGRIWEYSWQFLFTGRNIYCPAEHICYCGGFGLCFGGASEFRDFEELRQKKRHCEMEIDDLRSQRNERSNSSTLRYAYLNTQLSDLGHEMASRKQSALDRGLDPRNRAKECDARWNGVGVS